MIEPDRPFVGDMLLQDFADGRLDPKLAARVQDVLAEAPDLQRRAVEHMAVAHGIRQHFADYDAAPLPPAIEALGRQLQAAMRPRRALMPFRWAGMAAAASVAALLCGLAWYDTGFDAVRPLAGLDGFSAASDAQTPDLALTGTTAKAATALPALAPDFTDLGFKLLETRAIGGGKRDAVQLVYESEAGARVSLYYSDAAEGAASRVAVREEGALSMLFWQDDKRTFSMIGEVDRETLLTLGRAVSGQTIFDSVPGRAKPETSPDRRTEREPGPLGRAV